jgi:beta-xylosidase
VGKTFYAYATNANGTKIQVTSSTDLLNWKNPTEALPNFPAWAKPDSTLVWAPEVGAIKGSYNLYFTARDAASNKQCVGVAVGSQPDSFKSDSPQALVCQPDEGGDIDADIFTDTDGKHYLLYKNDGNCCSMPTNIYIQPLSEDGLSVTGTPTKLITNDVDWEGSVIEAPTMFKHDGKYYLFFSGNNYAGLPYAVGYATCSAVLGPCVQATENPILKSDTTVQPPVIGPGHQALLQLGQQTWIFYHVWDYGPGSNGGRRVVWMSPVNWVDGKPQVQHPLTGPQPVPVISGQ